MSFASQLPFASAACATVLAAGKLLRPRRKGSDWAFAVGMFMLAGEGVCVGMTALSTPDRRNDRLATVAACLGIPTAGNLALVQPQLRAGQARQFLTHWRLPLAAAFLLPIGCVAIFHPELVVSANRGGIAAYWMFPGSAGIALNIFLLTGSILIVMNLERTFQAAVGTMRWRIKFMLMAVGLLFVVRVYTTSQALLFRGADLFLQDLNAGMLGAAGLLALRSFIRGSRIDMDVHPSQSVLQGSVTVFLAGIYLVIVGVCAKCSPK